CQYAYEGGNGVLQYLKTDAGRPVKNGIKLRILPAGDSVTAGSGSSRNGGDGDGYRRRLRDNLSGNDVVFTGTVKGGTRGDGYYAAWPGRTIQYVSDHVGPFLDQRHNATPFAAGTNDMNEKPNVSLEGNDPQGAVDRLGKAIDKMIQKCPDATILVAIAVPTCHELRADRTREFQRLIPDMVRAKRRPGRKVLAADFSTFKTSDMFDCIHPDNNGYKVMGDYWSSFIHQIPEPWLQNPVGPDPDRSKPDADADTGGEDKAFACRVNPRWRATGKIVQGNVGWTGDFKYNTHWTQHGVDAEGIGRDGKYVRLHDMDGDGEAGEFFFTDPNGDLRDDYLVVEENDGSVRVWWNYGPMKGWNHGWKWVEGGVIAGGVPHANLATLRFPDLNRDGRADYIYIGEGGSVRSWLNVGQPGGQTVAWHDLGGIATGAVGAISRLVFADVSF
ncbi:family 3 carbohydrate esterase, partial [Colletotrichum somersetense]